jgi:hypothetical protein
MAEWLKSTKAINFKTDDDSSVAQSDDPTDNDCTTPKYPTKSSTRHQNSSAKSSKINMQEFFNRNDFRQQIENAMKEVSAEEIKNSILSFTNRVRQIENAGEK